MLLQKDDAGAMSRRTGWLAWSQEDLAKAAQVGLPTLKNFEGERRITVATQTAIRTALERKGFKFSVALDDDGRPCAYGISYSEPPKDEEH